MAQVDPSAWAALLACRPDLEGDPLLASWARRGWPLVIRRRVDGDDPNLVQLGLPLPPSDGKKRIAVELDGDAILGLSPPPLLLQVAAGLPPPWRATTAALLALDVEFGLETRVFGSWAWQAVTGLAYAGPRSDLDLLWALTPRCMELLARVHAIEAAAPGPIDGEIVGDGWANWRELADGADEVLVKDLTGVSLVPRSRFLAAASRVGQPA